MIPNEVRNLINAFSRLPSIGPRQATRLAYHLLNDDSTSIEALQAALAGLKKLQQCPQCFFYFIPRKDSSTHCHICADDQRTNASICIVEKETDLMSIEKAGHHEGTYIILGGHLSFSPAGEDRPQFGTQAKRARMRLENLKKHIREHLDGSAEEIIIAINPTSQGDLTALYLKKELDPYAKRISRLGRGLPTGGDIEFADEQTLAESFKNRS